jgi:GNAT superfamily N-acetyltransferase
MSVTTIYLEMTDASQLRPRTCPDPRFRVMEATTRQWQYNRFLYQFIGADWAWRDKLSWTDDQWRAYVGDESMHTFVACHDGSIAGYFELYKFAGEIQIAYFGLASSFIGKGLGGAFLTSALEEAWRMKPGRVWVHTCNLDHAFALKNYKDRGMVVYKTEVTETGNSP